MKRNFIIFTMLSLMAVPCNSQSNISNLSCPDNNHPHLIDLGLPSGTKWACCNVGANNPEEYGGYYAWGETKEKEVYNWNTYIHCDGSYNTCYDIGSNICGTKYDVAHVKWGGSWQMPSKEQIHELFENCEPMFEYKGISGWFLKGPNDNCIFLPGAGFRSNSKHRGMVFYWSGTQDSYVYFNAYSIDMHSNKYLYTDSFSPEPEEYNRRSKNWRSIGRYNGLSIRPVAK